MILAGVLAVLLTAQGQGLRRIGYAQGEGYDRLDDTGLEIPGGDAARRTVARDARESGGELPFGLELERKGEAFAATIVNGEERIAVPETRIEGAEVVFDMPHYDSQVRARIAPLGTRLEGTWRKRSGAEKWTEMAFAAEAGAAPRFRKGEALEARAVEGRYAVKFEKSEDPAVAIVRRGADGGVEGTFLTSTGDFRWLAGSVEGTELRLSCFDGAHAFLFRAFIGTGGSLRGDFWSGSGWHEAWTATPDPNAPIPDEFERAKWKDGFGLALLLYPDLEGRERCLGESELAGKATILQLLGTWCPNCHDETAYLARLHERYKDRGLSVVGLAFEHTPEFERSATQVRRMRERHGVQYPILIAGTSDKKRAAEAFPAIDRVLAFPTTIFLHRDGRVRAIHSGFAGPGTKEEHAKLTRQFESIVEELLAEPAVDDRATWEWFEAQSWRESRGELRVRIARDAADPSVRTELRGSTLVHAGDVWHVESGRDSCMDPRDYGRRIYRATSDPAKGRCNTDGALPRNPQEMWCLVRRRDSGAFVDVLDRLGSEDLLLRTSAAWAVGEFARDDLWDAGPALVALTRHGFASLRREAALSIGDIRYMDGGPAVRKLLSDIDPLVRTAARDALTRLETR